LTILTTQRLSHACDYKKLDPLTRDTVLERYRQNYGFPQDARIEASKVFAHWVLEVGLTER